LIEDTPQEIMSFIFIFLVCSDFRCVLQLTVSGFTTGRA
jgi:hypothetical protein